LSKLVAARAKALALEFSPLPRRERAPRKGWERGLIDGETRAIAYRDVRLSRRFATPSPSGGEGNVARRKALIGLSTVPWWLPALLTNDAFAQTSARPLDERVRSAKLERGGLSLDIPVVVETGTSVPIVLFADQSRLRNGVRVERLGVLAPKNPRPVAMEIELGPLMSQARITTNIRLGASQAVVGVAQLSDGTYWQHAINVVLTGSACYDGT
jgi:sulfur-oxidizing protein SoxY